MSRGGGRKEGRKEEREFEVVGREKARRGRESEGARNSVLLSEARRRGEVK